MSIAFVGAAYGGQTGSTSLTFSYTVGGGSDRLLVVCARGAPANEGANHLSATYDGVAMTLGAAKVSGSQFGDAYLFYMLNPPSGAHNVVITRSGGYTDITAVAGDYTGVNASGQPDATATNAGNGSLTTAITIATANSWAMGCETGVSYTTGVDPTGGTGATVRQITPGSGFSEAALFDSNADLATGSRSLQTVRSTGDFVSAHALVSFAPATSPPPPPPWFPMSAGGNPPPAPNQMIPY